MSWMSKKKAAEIFKFFQAEIISSQNNCTRGPLSVKFSWVRKVQRSTTHWRSVILNFSRSFSSIIYCYVTTISFLTLLIYYKLQNAQWSDEYSVYKINTDIHFMCELHVTMKLYRAECSLFDVDPNSFTKNSPCNLYNVCIVNREQITRNFRISYEKRSTRFSRIFLTPMWNIICARAWKFGICKSEKWLEKMFRLLFDLAKKTRGRTADVCWLCVHCVYCVKGKKRKDNLHITCFHELQELRTTCCWLSAYI